MEQEQAVELLRAASDLLEHPEELINQQDASPPREIARELRRLADEMQATPVMVAGPAGGVSGQAHGANVTTDPGHGTLRARMAAVRGRVDRVLQVPGDGELPVNVDSQDPLEFVGVGFDETPVDSDERTWALHLELHNPSHDAYTAQATLIFRDPEGGVASKEVFDFSTIEPYETGSQRQATWIPPDADTLMLRVTATLVS